jgi:hypothetical protein
LAAGESVADGDRERTERPAVLRDGVLQVDEQDA